VIARTAVLSLALCLPAVAAAAVPADATCTGTLAGAVKAEFACEVQATYDETKVTIVIAAVDGVSGVKTGPEVRLVVPYPLQLTTYTLATATEGEARVEVAPGQAYAAVGARGELSVSIDAAERYGTPRRRYNAKGVLTARLAPATPGAKGEVHLEVRF
jgi:hypothetical protein